MKMYIDRASEFHMTGFLLVKESVLPLEFLKNNFLKFKYQLVGMSCWKGFTSRQSPFQCVFFLPFSKSPHTFFSDPN